MFSIILYYSNFICMPYIVCVCVHKKRVRIYRIGYNSESTGCSHLTLVLWTWVKTKLKMFLFYAHNI